MSDFTIFVPLRTHADGRAGDPVSALQVQWHPEMPRVPAAAAARLEERWSAYVADARAQGKTLFNGPITRLIQAQRRGDGVVELHLGPEEYKTFVVAHLRDRAWFRENAPGVSAGALGNSVLLTRQDQALLGIRSSRVSAYAGRAHLVGGVLDLPAEAGAIPTPEDLVAHLLRELWEEARVLPADLALRGTWPRLLSVAQDELLSQPEAVWQWETIVPLDEVASRLTAEEHSGAMLLDRTQALPEGLWERLTPVARHAWQIWRSASR